MSSMKHFSNASLTFSTLGLIFENVLDLLSKKIKKVNSIFFYVFIQHKRINCTFSMKELRIFQNKWHENFLNFLKILRKGSKYI